MMQKERKQNNRLKLFRYGLIITISFLVVGCFSFKTMYDWADTYIEMEIDDYFNLTGDQDEFVDRQLDLAFQKHRTEEIPKYIIFLKGLKSRLKRDVTPDDIRWFRLSLKQFNDNIGLILADDVATFLSGISDEQIAYLENELSEKNEEWLEEHKPGKDRIEKIQDRVEDWIGDLTKEQKEWIVDRYGEEVHSYDLWYERRLASQKRFLNLVKKRPGQRKLKEELLDWYLNPEQFYSEAYKQSNKRFRKRTADLIVMLNKTGTSAQRNHIEEKVDEYLEQLEAIYSD